jgi:quercetin dioxygenase-like cupin family protein
LKTFERLAGLLLILFVIAACGQQAQEAAMEEEEPVVTEETTSAVRQAYPNLSSDVVFENDQIVAQRVTAEHGVWAGEHSHGEGQIAVVLKDATQIYREGGEETERVFAAGEVVAVEPTEAHDHMISSEGADFVLITLAPGQPGAATPQDYPNSPAEVVMENDRVIAQRLINEPGSEWVGEHAHPGGQLAVVIKGGTITYREGDEETDRTFTEGEVFMVEATAAHDHYVSSDSGIESILITLK